MSDYGKLIEALRDECDWTDVSDCIAYELLMHDAAAAIEALQALLTEADKKQAYQHDRICELTAENEELQAEVQDLNEALKSESDARQNAEAKRYCCNCAHMDASMYDEAWYGICKLNDFEVEAIHGWGCTDWAKMEVQDG